LKEVKSSGNLSGGEYTYVHTTPSKGLQYYRLVEYDLDGTKTIFPIKSILFDDLKKPVEVYPNVTTSNVTAYFKQAAFRRVLLIDRTGRIMESKDITKLEAQVNFDLTARAAGIYYLKFIGDESTVTERIIKQ
jgi:hypothetical protein